MNWESFDIITEDVRVGSAKTITESLAILMATYYVFNIEYPSELSKTLTFFEKAILKRSESSKKYLKVMDLIAHIN